MLHQDELNREAKKILENGTILVDMIVESENSRFMNIKVEDKIYFLRFMNDICYALVELKDCEKAPCTTVYPAVNQRYKLYNDRYARNKDDWQNSSNSLGYLLSICKRCKSENCTIIDSKSNTKVARVESGRVYRYITGSLKQLIVSTLSNILKEYNITYSGSIKVISVENKTVFSMGSKQLDISNSSQQDNLNEIIYQVEKLSSSGLESIIFRVSALNKSVMYTDSPASNEVRVVIL